MFKHKIFPLFSSFSKKDIVKFGEFLRSPYYNKSESLIRLYDEIIVFYPDFSTMKLTKKSLYKIVFTSESYKDSTVRNQLSRLLNLAQKYLLTEGFEKESLAADNYLLEELLIRNNNELFLKNLFSIENKIKKVLRFANKRRIVRARRPLGRFFTKRIFS